MRCDRRSRRNRPSDDVLLKMARRVARLPASVRLVAAPSSVVVPQTGAVASIQEAQLSLSREALESSWRPEYLERLARAYWRFLGHISLGLLRVVYSPDSRTVVLRFPALRLLTFGAPQYVTRPALGQVTWPVRRGLLVAKEGRDKGFLQITVRREGQDPAFPARELVLVTVGVQNFYPWLRGGGRYARFGSRLYGLTQLRIHGLVTRGFLRSLARIDLPSSPVGALRDEIRR